MMIKVNGLKLFPNRKDYLKMGRNEYLKYLAKSNPEKYKKFIVDEYTDDCHVYVSWYWIMLYLTGIILVFSIIFSSIWYIFLGVSILTLIFSKILKNNVERLVLGHGIIMFCADMFIKHVNSENKEQEFVDDLKDKIKEQQK